MHWGRRYGAQGDEGEEMTTFGQIYAQYVDRNEQRAQLDDKRLEMLMDGTPADTRRNTLACEELYAYIAMQVSADVPPSHEAYDAMDN